MKKLLLPLAIFAAALTGCVNADVESVPVEIINPNPPLPDPDIIAFKASLPSSVSTKAQILFRNYKQTWQKSDGIIVTCGDQSAAYTAYYGGRDTTTFMFALGDTLSVETGAKYSAYYPASIALGELPSSVSDYNIEKFFGLPMVAKAEREDAAAAIVDTLDFKPICGILEVPVYSAAKFIASNLTFSAYEPVCGAYTLDFSGDEPSITLTDKKSTSLTQVFGSGMRMSSSAAYANKVWFAIPEGTYTEVRLSSICKTGDKPVYYENIFADPIVIKKGAVTTLSATELTLVPESIVLKEHANCHMIWKAGKYYIDPVKGNSDISVGDVAKVKLLWETDNNSAAPVKNSIVSYVKYDTDSSKIVFNIKAVPSTGGNALIAATDESGEILWTWHIWMPVETTSTTRLGDQDYDNEAGKYLMMTNNIGQSLHIRSTSGASGASYSSPLVYQWGRPVPFITQTRDQKDCVPAGEIYTTAGAPVTMEVAIKNPMKFYVGEEMAWYSEMDEPFWSATEKTIYDPCPDGYRVCSKDVWDGTFLRSLKQGNSRGPVFYTPEEDYWYTHFSANSGISGTKGEYSKAGSDAYLWNAEMNEAGTKASSTYISSSDITVSDKYPIAGYGVRCQKMNNQ